MINGSAGFGTLVFSCGFFANSVSIYDWENNPIFKTVFSWNFFPVFRNPQLLLTAPDSDPAPDPALFVSDVEDANKKVFCLFFLKVHLHNSSKIKSHKRSHKFVEIKVFLTVFA